MSNKISMIPCAYAHFLARSETIRLKALEQREKMEEEGACEEVLEELERLATAAQRVCDSIKFAKLLREQQIDDERATNRAAREAEVAARRAAKEAKKSEKKSEPKPVRTLVPSAQAGVLINEQSS